MRDFFPLSRGDLAFLIIVLAWAFVAFLPWARDIHVLGVALVGWLLAALMIVAPAVALIRVWRERPAGVAAPEDEEE